MKLFAPAVLTTAVLLLSSCSATKIVNPGGDTKCKDFLTQEEKKRSGELGKMLKDRNGVDPNDLQLTATRVSVLTYCQIRGKEDSKISEAPHG